MRRPRAAQAKLLTGTAPDFYEMTGTPIPEPTPLVPSVVLLGHFKESEQTADSRGASARSLSAASLSSLSAASSTVPLAIFKSRLAPADAAKLSPVPSEADDSSSSPLTETVKSCPRSVISTPTPALELRRLSLVRSDSFGSLGSWERESNTVVMEDEGSLGSIFELPQGQTMPSTATSDQCPMQVSQSTLDVAPTLQENSRLDYC